MGCASSKSQQHPNDQQQLAKANSYQQRKQDSFHQTSLKQDLKEHKNDLNHVASNTDLPHDETFSDSGKSSSSSSSSSSSDGSCCITEGAPTQNKDDDSNHRNGSFPKVSLKATPAPNITWTTTYFERELSEKNEQLENVRSENPDDDLSTEIHHQPSTLQSSLNANDLDRQLQVQKMKLQRAPSDELPPSQSGRKIATKEADLEGKYESTNDQRSILDADGLTAEDLERQIQEQKQKLQSVPSDSMSPNPNVNSEWTTEDLQLQIQGQKEQLQRVLPDEMSPNPSGNSELMAEDLKRQIQEQKEKLQSVPSDEMSLNSSGDNNDADLERSHDATESQPSTLQAGLQNIIRKQTENSSMQEKSDKVPKSLSGSSDAELELAQWEELPPSPTGTNVTTKYANVEPTTDEPEGSKPSTLQAGLQYLFPDKKDKSQQEASREVAPDPNESKEAGMERNPESIGNAPSTLKAGLQYFFSEQNKEKAQRAWSNEMPPTPNGSNVAMDDDNLERHIIEQKDSLAHVQDPDKAHAEKVQAIRETITGEPPKEIQETIDQLAPLN